MTEIQLKSNQFWGNRSGKIAKVTKKWDGGSRIEYQFFQKRRNIKTSDNKGPCGWKAKKNRRYSNRKLNKISRRQHV